MKRLVCSKESRRGMALLTALIFIAVTVLVLVSLMGRYTQQRLQVDRFEDAYLVFEAAEAAREQCVAEIENAEEGIIGLDGWTPVFDDGGNLVLPAFDDPDVVPASMATMPDIRYIGYAYPWFGDGRDSDGNGAVDDIGEFGMFSIHTAAISDRVGDVRQIESVYSSEDLNVWNNAIFGGTGQTGNLVNGNVSIHGSVHLLGDDLPAGGVAVQAMDLSGGALISNNYNGMPAALEVRVPPLPTRIYGGETVETLNTKVRVRNGLVGISGNAHIGQAQAAGSGVKGPVDGTFNNDGWTGNSVTPDGGRGIPFPSRFYSDNGHTARYDLGNRVPMPYLDDDWREPDGTRVMDPDTGTWYTHETYFTEVLLADPVNETDGIRTGNIVLNVYDKKGTAVYWNATTNQYLTGAAAVSATPGVNDDYLKFNPATNTLLMNGQIRINGNLSFVGSGNDTKINYSGRAAFLVDGTVTIDTDLLACNNGNPANTVNCFPVNNIIGIMSTGDMMVGSTSQLSMMGAFYSEGACITEKQSNILGTFVANYFNMGKNVPSIFQVPELARNLPYGMIGNYPIVILSLESWRELGIE